MENIGQHFPSLLFSSLSEGSTSLGDRDDHKIWKRDEKYFSYISHNVRHGAVEIFPVFFYATFVLCCFFIPLSE